MRKVVFILVVSLYPLISFSQLIVSSTKMNILYIGVDNTIEFNVNGYNNKDLILTPSCGKLRNQNGQFIWSMCNEYYTTVKFSCYFKNKTINKLLGTLDYRIKRSPDPIVKLGESNHSGIFRLPHFVAAILEGFDFEMRFSVKEFKVEIYKINGDTLKFRNLGNELGKDLSDALKSMAKGESFIFQEFIVSNECDSKERILTDKVKYTMPTTARPANIAFAHIGA